MTESGVRKTLIKLINSIQNMGAVYTPSQMDDRYGITRDIANEEIANHLIANDVTIQVHGRWIEHPNVEKVDGKWISNYECSGCCCFYRTHENYCGFCGARMDGDSQ